MQLLTRSATGLATDPSFGEVGWFSARAIAGFFRRIIPFLQLLEKRKGTYVFSPEAFCIRISQ